MDEVKIELTVRSYLTEEKEKVKLCLENLFDIEDHVFIEEEKKRYTQLTVKGSKHLLQKMKKLFHERGQKEIVLNALKRNRRGYSSRLLLDKQAAYAGRIGIISSPAESSLGPVIVKINWEKEKEYQSLLDWLETLR